MEHQDQGTRIYEITRRSAKAKTKNTATRTQEQDQGTNRSTRSVGEVNEPLNLWFPTATDSQNRSPEHHGGHRINQRMRELQI